MAREPLKLMPIDDLKKAAAALAQVTKEDIKKAAERAKAPDYPAGKPRNEPAKKNPRRA